MNNIISYLPLIFKLSTMKKITALINTNRSVMIRYRCTYIWILKTSNVTNVNKKTTNLQTYTVDQNNFAIK